MSVETKGADFVISREFAAPREMLWKCFTEPERMKEWWGPKGCTIVASNMDLRVGGTYLGAMRDPTGRVMWAKFVYREIVAPKLLKWVHSFSDEAGGLTRHPFSPTWPLEMLTTVTFEEAPEGQDQAHIAVVTDQCVRRRTKHIRRRRVTACMAAGPARSSGSMPISPGRNSAETLLKSSNGIRHGERQTEDCAVSVVRHAGRRCGDILHLGVQEFPHHRYQLLCQCRPRGARREPGSVMVVEFDLDGQIR